MKEKTSYDIQSVLREMRDEYWRGLEATEEESHGEAADYLILRLGGERIGIATGLAREVLRTPRLIRVPQVPAHIRGVINLRGQIVAVTDLGRLLGLSEATAAGPSRLVVVTAEGLTTALLIDAVEGIRSVPLAAIEPLTDGLARFPREAVVGQLADGDGLVVLLDLPQLFRQANFIVEQQAE